MRSMDTHAAERGRRRARASSRSPHARVALTVLAGAVLLAGCAGAGATRGSSPTTPATASPTTTSTMPPTPITSTAPSPASTVPSAATAGPTTVGLCTFPGAIPKPAVATSGAPEVATQGPGTMAASTSSPMLANAYQQFNTMSCTHYQHTYSEDTATGVYDYDCVGFTTYTLSQAMPNAHASANEALEIKSGYVPSPTLYQRFFQDLAQGTTANAWQAVPTASAIQPGDLLAWVTSTTSEAGHSVLALSTPTPIDVSQATDSSVPSGSKAYALIVMDSTATTHGPDDTRTASNPLSARNAPLGTGATDGSSSASTTSTPTDAPSGLGIGTIGLIANADDQVIGVTWTLGTANEKVPFGACRPLS